MRKPLPAAPGSITPPVKMLVRKPSLPLLGVQCLRLKFYHVFPMLVTQNPCFFPETLMLYMAIYGVFWQILAISQQSHLHIVIDPAHPPVSFDFWSKNVSYVTDIDTDQNLVARLYVPKT